MRSDEYNQGDPYEVAKNINNHFQKCRVYYTNRLLQNARTNKDEIKILDVGCGEGHLTNKLEIKEGDRISACDLSEMAIKRGEQLYPDIDFKKADALDLPYQWNYFDVVICNNLIEHVDSPSRLLKEMNRVLKSGGYVIISTPSRYRVENILRLICGKKIKLASKYHVSEYSVGQVKEMASGQGFNVKKVVSGNIKRGRNSGIMQPQKIILNIAKVIIRLPLFIIRPGYVLDRTAFYLLKKY